MAAMRVLVAGTSDAIEAVRMALQHDSAHIVAAYSVHEALQHCAREEFDVIACNVRFDESRMFEFLQALMQRSPPCAGRILSFRTGPEPLAANTRHAIRQALEALGVARFVDLVQIEQHYDGPAAIETLRKMVLDEHFVPPAPPED